MTKPRAKVDWTVPGGANHRQRRDALVAVGRKEVAEHLRECAAGAQAYIEEYADFMCSPQRQGPPRNHGIHPLLTKMIREVLRDASVAETLRRRKSYE